MGEGEGEEEGEGGQFGSELERAKEGEQTMSDEILSKSNKVTTDGSS